MNLINFYKTKKISADLFFSLEDSKAILEVRNYLKDKMANLDKNWKNEWVNFLKNVN